MEDTIDLIGASDESDDKIIIQKTTHQVIPDYLNLPNKSTH